MSRTASAISGNDKGGRVDAIEAEEDEGVGVGVSGALLLVGCNG